jgi:hypothetical protein
MLRCAVSFVVAAYDEVRLTPHDLRALPAEHFTQPSFSTFYGFVKSDGNKKGRITALSLDPANPVQTF